MDLKKLRDPFPPEDLEWRVQRSGVKNGRVWAIVVPYITNRAIMDRLDDVCGPENWANQYQAGPSGGVLCGITISMQDGTVVDKWDGAENTDIEQVKGGLSGAMKRAAVQWGIGRYLYKLPQYFANIIETDHPDAHTDYAKDQNGQKARFKWLPPQLPSWALPEGTKQVPRPKENQFDSGPVPGEDGGDPPPEPVPDEKREERVASLKSLVDAAFAGGKMNETTHRNWIANLSSPTADLDAMTPVIESITGAQSA